MTQINSQEQTIYRNLSSRIQLGFYPEGEPFPSVKELAEWYQVSYCPAQRALKALEKDGLIQLCRGKETVVTAKPYADFLSSTLFCRRADAIMDLCKSLQLVSKHISYQGMAHMEKPFDQIKPAGEDNRSYYVRYLYRIFEQTIRSLGSQIVLNLYYDIGAFVESTFIDLLCNVPEEEVNSALLYTIVDEFHKSREDCSCQNYILGQKRLEEINRRFFEETQRRLKKYCGKTDPEIREEFTWQPYKGRTKYCDVIAVDLVCKINHGIYPAGSLLPNGAMLADHYHVSEITIRRTISLLNRLGLVKTFNGIGTRVVGRVDASMPYRLKSLKIDSNLKLFLEALQLLVITGEAVLQYTLPYCSDESLDTISGALNMEMQNVSIAAVTGACLQAVIRTCPLKGIREIYKEVTLLLLNGSILQISGFVKEQTAVWYSVSDILKKSLQKRDFPSFAAAFRRMLEKLFTITRQTLLEVGIDGVEKIVDPIHPAVQDVLH